MLFRQITKRFLFVSSILLLSVSAIADEPFRNHRFSSMMTTPVAKDNIVFVGNSITNMHPWAEAFSSGNIVGRGTSGAVSREILNNVQSFISGRPEKMFLMIGTNDMADKNADYNEIIDNIRQFIVHIQKESPRTKIYLQAVMPSCNGNRTVERTHAFNELQKALAEDMHVTFVDHENALMPVSTYEMSYDLLHPNVLGNRIWCEQLAPYIGKNVKVKYPEQPEVINGGMQNSFGARLSSLSLLPVKRNNILFVGDDLMHNTEWHELLHNSNILNRGTGWGCWTEMDIIGKYIEPILRGREGNEQPKQIVLHTGRQELASSTADIEDVKAKYSAIVKEIMKLSPTTRISLLAVAPYGVKEINKRNLLVFNAWLKEVAEKCRNIDYIDIYTPLVDSDDCAKADYYSGNYVMGLGIIQIARTIAPFVKDSSVSKYAENQFDIMLARKELSNAIDRAERVLKKQKSDGILRPEIEAKIREAINEGYTKLAENTIDVSAIGNITKKIISSQGSLIVN